MKQPASLFLGLLTLTALAACGQQLAQTPTTPGTPTAAEDVAAPDIKVYGTDGNLITAPPGGEEGRSGKGMLQAQNLTATNTVQNYIADVTLTTTTSSTVPGFKPSTYTAPAGMQAAFMFEGNETKMRMNMPGSAFPDGRGRILLYSTATDQAGILFADTQQPDYSISKDQISQLLKQQMGAAVSQPTGPDMLMTQSLQQFAAQSGLSAQSVQQMSRDDRQPGVLYFTTQTQAFGTDGGTITTKRIYDPQKSLVTRYDSAMSLPKVDISSQTKVTHTDVPYMTGVKIPTHINTAQTTTVKGLGSTVTASQDVQYNNVRVNNLPSSYFSVGGF